MGPVGRFILIRHVGSASAPAPDPRSGPPRPRSRPTAAPGRRSGPSRHASRAGRGVGHRRGMADQALHAAQGLGEREDLGALGEPRAFSSARARCDTMPPKPAHLAAGQVVLRVGRQAGVVNARCTLAVLLSHCAIRRPLASCWRIRSGRVLVPRRHNQQSNGPGTAPAAFWMNPSPLGHVVAGAPRAARRSCRCGRSGTWWWSGARCRRPSSSGR